MLALTRDGKYLYTSDARGTRITGFAVDPTTGELTAAGTPVEVADAGGIKALAASRSGAFLFAGTWSSHKVLTYAIDADTGALTAVGAPLDAGLTPRAIAVDADDRWVYVLGYSSETISVYSLAADGTLTAAGTYDTGSRPKGLLAWP